ncbi:MAG: hypothetical protein JST30_05635 [Armatimonadetes bacterium]|nr:hypothetical protein [Armatimonadota bacterium]
MMVIPDSYCKKQPSGAEINQVANLNKGAAINMEDVDHLLRLDKNMTRPLALSAAFNNPEYAKVLKQANTVPFGRQIQRLEFVFRESQPCRP